MHKSIENVYKSHKSISPYKEIGVKEWNAGFCFPSTFLPRVALTYEFARIWFGALTVGLITCISRYASETDNPRISNCPVERDSRNENDTSNKLHDNVWFVDIVRGVPLVI